MRNIWTFTKREYWHYFVSPTAYVVATVFLVILGLIFLSSVLGAPPGAPPNPTAANGAFVTLFLFFAPVLTMRLLADEQRSGTMELLLTGPIKEWEMVIGKWLGVWLFSLTVLALTGVYPLVLNIYGNPDMGPVWSSYLGLALLFGAILSIGVFASSFTSNIVVAVMLGYGFVLTIWIIQILSNFVGLFALSVTGGPIELINNVIRYLNFPGHNTNFSRGVIDTSDATYYISLIILMLYLATRVVETRRWR